MDFFNRLYVWITQSKCECKEKAGHSTLKLNFDHMLDAHNSNDDTNVYLMHRKTLRIERLFEFIN